MADIDRARLRALAEKARDAEAAYLALPNTAPADDVLRLGRARNNASHALEHAASPDAILALLDALDAAERERGEARAQRDDTAIEFDVAWGAALKANAERDALAQPEQPTCPHIRSSGSGEWATHWCEPNGPPAAPEPSANERRLRRLLCIVKHGRSAYMDDGEAQDSSAHPSIDYLRDSLDEIEAKWRLRASATLTAPEPSEAEVAAAMASLYRAMEPAAWPSEDEVTDALRAAAAARGK